MFKKQETGRSMVEMLGVLAVIGVLSVAGIAGYTSAMRNHRANEILNAVAKLYVLGQSQNQGAGNKEVTYSTTFKSVPSGAQEMTYHTDGTITVTATNEDDCKVVKDKLGDKAGDCLAAVAPDTGYTLTVTLGEKKENAVTYNQENVLWWMNTEEGCQTGEHRCGFYPNRVQHYIIVCSDGFWLPGDQSCPFGCSGNDCASSCPIGKTFDTVDDMGYNVTMTCTESGWTYSY